MDFPTLTTILKKTFEISNPKVEAKQIKRDFISITWRFDVNTRSPDECIEITHKLKYDDTQLNIELEKKGQNISPDKILKAFEHYWQEILPLVINSNYEDLANTVLKYRGDILGSKLGIT